MANIKSAIKRAKTNEKRRVHRVAQKTALIRTPVKKFLTAVEASNVEEATVLFREVSRSLDKAVTKGLLHKNAAARRKSRLAKKLNALQVAQ